MGIISAIGLNPRIAIPIPCPIIVSSRIPASKILVSPYFACNPLKPWFTSPIFPTSSPKATTKGLLANNASKYLFKTSKPFIDGALSAITAFVSLTFNALFSPMLYK